MNDRGIAMLIVLWALLLLGTLAMSFSFSMRTEAQASRNGMDAVRAYYQARTGIARAALLLRTLPPDNVTNLAVTGGDPESGYDARIEREGGKVDLNFVSEEMLKGILRQAGLPEAEEEALGDAILDWRDEDDLPRRNGAEAPYYAALPEPARPRNGKLESVGELRYVRGVTPELYDRFLSKVFTVHGGVPQVNVNDAPPEVLRALPGFTPEAADRLAKRREEAPFRSPAELSIFLGETGVRTGVVPLLSTVSLSRYFTVTATGRSGGTVARTLRCTMDVAGGTPDMVKIVRWEDQVPTAEEGR